MILAPLTGTVAQATKTVNGNVTKEKKELLLTQVTQTFNMVTPRKWDHNGLRSLEIDL
jgi:hypothetical protein